MTKQQMKPYIIDYYNVRGFYEHLSGGVTMGMVHTVNSLIVHY